ncbi:ABC transporter permease [Sphingomonas oryzagri]
MNRFALLTLYRSLTRHRLYAALNIGGLAVGIAVFLVLGLYVRFETSYEKWLLHHDQLYLVQTLWNSPDSPFDGAYPNTMGGLLEEMKADFPGLVGTRIDTQGASVIRGGVGTSEDLARVDAGFFRVFELPMVSGTGEEALRDPSNVLIDKNMADKYFGETDPVGQTLTLNIVGVTRPYRVAGVFAPLPKATELKFAMLVRLPDKPGPDDVQYWYHWGSTSLYTYLRFPTRPVAQAFAAKMPDFVNRHGRKDLGAHPNDMIGLRLLPITEDHLTPEGREMGSVRQTIITLGMVGLLTLLIAIVNYVNLATARAGLRAREVAMRKVLGASRSALVRQFIGEAVMTVAVSALVALALAELGLPLVNAAGGLSLSIPYAVTVPALLLLVILMGVGAGFYPALILSRFPAAAVLASARSPGGGRAGARVRELLVVFQFTLAIAFIIGTLVLVAQTRHLRRADLGFARNGLIIVKSLPDPTLNASQRASLLAIFANLSMIRAVGTADSNAGGSGQNDTESVPIPGRPGSGPSLREIGTGPGFFQVYGARLLAGRLFDDRHGGDDAMGRKSADTRNIVINRRAVSTLGFASPEEAVGKVVGGSNPRMIIGVIEDMRFFSPHVPMDATYYLYYSKGLGFPVATLRYTGGFRAAMDAVRVAWRRIAPEVPFDAASGDQRLADFYKSDDHAARLFTIGAILAVLIGCVGLWGLASFNTSRRVKEIGIRKTLGASSTDIVKLLVGQFLRPVLIANLIAWPLAWIAMRQWLAGFDDRIVLSPLYFVTASLLALGIAVLTVIAQSLRAARATPAWALRHE